MSITNYKIDLLGNYQSKNIKAVLLACQILQQNKWQISEQNIKNGLEHIKKNTGIFGRFDILSTEPIIIADVAHNAEGIAEVLTQIKNIPHQQLHIITGFVADKAIDKVLKIMPQDAQYYFTHAHIPRALPKEKLQLLAKEFGLNGLIFEHVNEALLDAKSNANNEDIILICGSFFVLAEMD